ncbi:MAG: prepilin-type N-terminal cleavage/methylation domain-containing protein [Planctomycetota bacterium]|nr:prepilin-type N-terminal cleavage/methylation domain-containing protein [Planctomycetota bacterium]
MKPRDSRRPAFSLVELLVVIATIAILIAILLPALAKARACVRTTRELAAAQHLMLAFGLYADASRGRVLTGYPTRTHVEGPIEVFDEEGRRLTGELAQRYPWRLAPFLDLNFRGLYQDANLLRDLREQESTYTDTGIDYEYVVSLYPSLGMNIAFVGGSDRHDAFSPLFRRVFGRVHVEQTHEPRRPTDLIVFASARAEDPGGLPLNGPPQGYFRLEPPRFSAARGPQWQPAYEPASTTPGANSGYLSLRHSSRKAVTARFDGHASLASWDQLTDMRLWADNATSADWTISPR